MPNKTSMNSVPQLDVLRQDTIRLKLAVGSAAYFSSFQKVIQTCMPTSSSTCTVRQHDPCKMPGKRPLGSWKTNHGVSDDLNTLSNLATTFNFAVVSSPDLLVLDVDGEAGASALSDRLSLRRPNGDWSAWISQFPTLIDTRKPGSYHIYFSTEATVFGGVFKGSSQGHDGVDVLGAEGHLAILPGSLYPDGSIRKWIAGHSPSEYPQPAMLSEDWAVALNNTKPEVDLSDIDATNLPDTADKFDKLPVELQVDLDTPIDEGSRSELGMSLMNRLHHLGWTDAEIASVMTDPAHSFASSWALAKNGGDRAKAVKWLQTQIAKTHDRDLDPSKEVKPPQFVRENAKLFLQAQYDYNVQGKTCRLRYYQEDFYGWNGTHYRRLSEQQLKSFIGAFFDGTYYKKQVKDTVLPTPVPVGPALEQNVLDECRNLVLVDDELRQPLFLDGTPLVPGAKAEDFIPLKNGLLHVPTNTLYKHNEHPTARLFVTYSAPFDYDSQAECPQWTAFLGSVWEGDLDSQALLQEWFGYCLVGDLRHQKMLQLYGPTRSGKGTMAAVLEALIGSKNVAAPSSHDVERGSFAIQDWVDKQLILFGDATAAEKSGQLKEQLLRIVGNDKITIQRKYRDAWSGRLHAKVMILGNRPLQMEDSAGALAARTLLLRTYKSFADNPDTELLDKLLKELPGIFNWALVGLKRLNEHGRFTEVQSNAEYLREITVSSDPMLSFIDEYIQPKLDGKLPQKDLRNAYNAFLKEYDPSKQNVSQKAFGRLFEEGLQTLGWKLNKRKTEEGVVWEGIDCSYKYMALYGPLPKVD